MCVSLEVRRADRSLKVEARCATNKEKHNDIIEITIAVKSRISFTRSLSAGVAETAGVVDVGGLADVDGSRAALGWGGVAVCAIHRGAAITIKEVKAAYKIDFIQRLLAMGPKCIIHSRFATP